MAKRLTSMIIIAAASMWALTGCDQGAETASQSFEAAGTTRRDVSRDYPYYRLVASSIVAKRLPISQAISIHLRSIAKMSVIMQNISR